MPKSRNRKNHKQKVKARNQRIQATRNQYQKIMQTEMAKYLEKLSGMTETQSTENTSESVL